jgi:hypothetical protein
VPREVGRDKVGEVADGRQSGVDRLALEHESRGRLARERHVPGRGIRAQLQDLLGLVGEPRGDLRIERMSSPLPDDASGVVGAAEHVLEGRVARDVGDPYRQWDLVAPGATQHALAVPALRQVDEQARHGRGQTQALGEHPRHLAEGDEMLLVRPRGLRQASGDLSRARGDVASGRRQRPDHTGHHLGP